MKPLRAILIDDEQKGLDALKILIEKYIVSVKIVAESTKPFEAIELIENYKPEIVFLDINMPEMNGFELLEKLSWKNFNLVFTTAHQEHALKALKVNAFDYLLKPIDHEDLKKAIDKISAKIENDLEDKFNFNDFSWVVQPASKSKIIINSKSGIESVNVSEIVYLESKSNYTHIHLQDSKTILTSKTLKEFEDQLCVSGFDFMRVHNSFVINLTKVARYVKSDECVILAGDLKIPLSKSKRDAFYAWLDV